MAAQEKERAIPLSTNERQFLLAALAKGVRVDGRSPLDYRAMKITFSGQSGRVEVQLGSTRVLACVTADIVAPRAEHPAEGFLRFYANLSEMASPVFSSKERQSERAVELSRIIERAVRDSRAIDTEALCVMTGEKVWSIRCDIHGLDDDGNLIDCAGVAAVTALLSFRRPDVTVIGDRVTIHSVEEKQPVPLALHHTPVCITFAFLGDENRESGKDVMFVVDPCYKELRASLGKVTFTVNQFKEVCAVQKAGGVEVPLDQLMQCASSACVKALQIVDFITKCIKEHEEKPVAPRVLGTQEALDHAAAQAAKAKLSSHGAVLTMDDDS